MKKQIILFTALAVLTACSESEGSSEVNHKGFKAADMTQTTAETTRRMNYYDDDTEQEVIRVRALSYKNQELTYEYEGKTRTLPLPLSVFEDDEESVRPTVSESIINNHLGIEISADIILSGDKQSIIFCDVIYPNGIRRYFADTFARELGITGNNVRDKLMNMKRVGETGVEFTLKGSTIRGDINDLPYFYKGKIPESSDRAGFTGYRFKTGELLLTKIYFYNQALTEGKSFETSEYTGFFGTVQSVSEGRAQVLLNDGVTVCDVPTALHDLEVTEGQHTMLLLEQDKRLYGSGIPYKTDCAVFVSNLEYESLDKCDFDILAYETPREGSLYKRDLVTKAMLEKGGM